MVRALPPVGIVKAGAANSKKVPQPSTGSDVVVSGAAAAVLINAPPAHVNAASLSLELTANKNINLTSMEIQ